MKLSSIKQLIDKLEECDTMINALHSTHRSPFDGYSVHMIDALHGAVLERKNSLLDQMKRNGIEVEV